MKKQTKLLSIVLSAMLLIGALAVLPVSAEAEPEESQVVSPEESAEEEESKASIIVLPTLPVGIPGLPWDEPVDEDFSYSLLGDGTAEIVGYNGEEAQITIPGEIMGVRVSKIGDYALSECSCLTDVEISQGIETIGEGAFSGCENLTAVTAQEGLTAIGAWAFSGCTALETLTLPDSVVSMGRDAFKNTAWLENREDGVVYAGKTACCYKGEMPENTAVALEDGTKVIADYAFINCTNLKSVALPEGVVSLGAHAFDYCTGLESINIPAAVTDIGTYCFYGCSALASVEIPQGVTELDKCTFYNCESLGDISFPDSLSCIMDTALDGTAWFENQGDGVVYAGKVAYSYKGEPDTDFAEIIQDGTLGVSPLAFIGQEHLTAVTVPESVEYIGDFSMGYYFDEDAGEITPLESFKIYGVQGSEAQTYARKNRITFVKITNDPTDAPTQTASQAPSATEPGGTQPTVPTATEPTEGTKATQPTEAIKPKTTVKKANPLTVSVKTKKIKAKKLKKAKQTVKAITVSKAKGKVSYAKLKSGTTKKIFKKITITKNGKITLKKGKYKKGTYKIKVKVTAKGNSSYKSKSKTVTVRVKVK